MAGRLARLDALVARGVLTPEQAKIHKAAVLTAPNDLTVNLMEAEDLHVKVRSQGVCVRDNHHSVPLVVKPWSLTLLIMISDIIQI